MSAPSTTGVEGADDQERLARAAWSRIAEPADTIAGALVRAVGPVDALRWLESLTDGGSTWSPAREVSTTQPSRNRGTMALAQAQPPPSAAPVTRAGPGEVVPTARVGPALAGPAGAAAPAPTSARRQKDRATGQPPRDDVTGSPASVRRGVVGLCEVLGVDDPTVQRRLMSATGRWLLRAGRVDPEVDLTNLGRLGGRLVVPGDREWPTQIDDLGDETPFCLWVRGTVRVDEALAGAVSIVGARASTDYGERIAAEMAAGLVEARRGTVSGGAYGIDAAVHKATLAVDGVTVAFLAGGVDRLYPAGNTALLRAVVDRGGLLLSEVPPGAVPSRVRFLRRNRLIAAAGRSTVVVEAAWRSGSLVTARLAAGLGRPVGAVPGPVTSAASAGSHRLMREGVAVCVTDVAEVLELTGAAGDGVAELAEQEARRDESGARPDDGLDDGATATLDALPVRRPATVEALARSSGLAPHEVMSALGVLELRGQAARSEAGWRRAGRGRGLPGDQARPGGVL